MIPRALGWMFAPEMVVTASSFAWAQPVDPYTGQPSTGSRGQYGHRRTAAVRTAAVQTATSTRATFQQVSFGSTLPLPAPPDGGSIRRSVSDARVDSRSLGVSHGSLRLGAWLLRRCRVRNHVYVRAHWVRVGHQWVFFAGTLGSAGVIRSFLRRSWVRRHRARSWFRALRRR